MYGLYVSEVHNKQEVRVTAATAGCASSVSPSRLLLPADPETLKASKGHLVMWIFGFTAKVSNKMHGMCLSPAHSVATSCCVLLVSKARC